jgi:hypothetical protein
MFSRAAASQIGSSSGSSIGRRCRRLRGAHAEVLHELAKAERAGFHVGFQLLCGALAESRARRCES